MPSYGRNAVAEPFSSLARMHVWDGVVKLTSVDHEPATPVLDQEDLLTQGINTATLVPGAQRVDALGSCVPNASVSALGALLSPPQLAAAGILPSPSLASPSDAAVIDEERAITLYHDMTALTGDAADEWPAVDCGSSGYYACQYLQSKGIISGHKVASGAENICSLMQSGGLIVGQPFFYSWEQPNTFGFIDGNGTQADLQAAMDSGVAGGHETYWEAIENIAFTATGLVDPQRTVIRFRNSWSTSWADQGCARAHLSTFIWLASQVDYRQFVA
jgi:hypothetical protein